MLPQVSLAGPRAARTKMNTGKNDSNKANNFLLIVSETTPSSPPDMVLHNRTHKAIIRTQQTLCVYALLLGGHYLFHLIYQEDG
jgi:hypothetical protein